MYNIVEYCLELLGKSASFCFRIEFRKTYKMLRSVQFF